MASLGRRLGALVLLAAALALGGQGAAAQETSEGQQRGGVVINLPPNPNFPVPVVVVDVQRILEEANAVQAMQKRLADARQAFQSDMRAREAELQERDRLLAADRATMDPQRFQSERDQLAADLGRLQEDIRIWFAAHDRALNQAMRQAQDTLLHIVGDMARQRGAYLVLPKSSTVLVQSDLDITEEALKRLNEELPSLPLPDDLLQTGVGGAEQ